MTSFKITVVQITPVVGLDGAPAPVETKIFEQTIDDLNLRSFVRQVNAAPRARRNKATKAATA